MTSESVKQAAGIIIKICGVVGILYLIWVATLSGYLMQVDAIDHGAHQLSWVLVVLAWVIGLVFVLYSTLKAVRSIDLMLIIVWFAIAFVGALSWIFFLRVLTAIL